MLNRKNRLFKNYKKHGYKAVDKVRLEEFRHECQKAVEFDNPRIYQKSYWKIIHRVMNTCRAPKIPPLVINNQFILD